MDSGTQTPSNVSNQNKTLTKRSMEDQPSTSNQSTPQYPPNVPEAHTANARSINQRASGSNQINHDHVYRINIDGTHVTPRAANSSRDQLQKHRSKDHVQVHYDSLQVLQEHQHMRPPPNVQQLQQHLHMRSPPNVQQLQQHLHMRPPPNVQQLQQHLHMRSPPNVQQLQQHLHMRSPPNVQQLQQHLHMRSPPNVQQLQQHLHMRSPPNIQQLQQHLHMRSPHNVQQLQQNLHMRSPPNVQQFQQDMHLRSPPSVLYFRRTSNQQQHQPMPIVKSQYRDSLSKVIDNIRSQDSLSVMGTSGSGMNSAYVTNKNREQKPLTDNLQPSDSDSDSDCAIIMSNGFNPSTGNYSRSDLSIQYPTTSANMRMHPRAIVEQQMLDQLATFFRQMREILFQTSEFQERLKSSTVEATETYKELLEKVNKFNELANSASSQPSNHQDQAAQKTGGPPTHSGFTKGESSNSNEHNQNPVRQGENIKPTVGNNDLVTFILPKEYEEDSRWTLKYRNNNNISTLLAELLPDSGIYVSRTSLTKCKLKSRNCSELAKGLLEAVFNKAALSVCLSATEKPDPRCTSVRPSLNPDAMLVLVTFVKKYGRRCGWKTDEEIILSGIHSKIQEIRHKFGKKKG